MSTEKPNDSNENISLDTIAQKFVEGMPEAQDHVIEEHQREKAEEEAIKNTNKGSEFGGVRFDPEIHQMNDDGTPILGKRGKPLRKKGSGTRTRKPKGGLVPPPGPTPEDKQRAAGIAAASAVFMLGTTLGGDEWIPVKNEEYNIDERRNMEQAFGDYFVAKGVEDFPPGIALSLALVGYAGPRFAAPKTRTKLGKVKEWFMVKIAKRRARSTKSDKPVEKGQSTK